MLQFSDDIAFAHHLDRTVPILAGFEVLTLHQALQAFEIRLLLSGVRDQFARQVVHDAGLFKDLGSLASGNGHFELILTGVGLGEGSANTIVVDAVGDLFSFQQSEDLFDTVFVRDTGDPHRHFVFRHHQADWSRLQVGFEIAVVFAVTLFAILSSLASRPTRRRRLVLFGVLFVLVKEVTEVIFSQILVREQESGALLIQQGFQVTEDIFVSYLGRL